MGIRARGRDRARARETGAGRPSRIATHRDASRERRANDWRQGGGGGQKQNARIAERREKDILVGKITELYAAKGDDPPFGLASSDLATLRRHLERMRDRK